TGVALDEPAAQASVGYGAYDVSTVWTFDTPSVPAPDRNAERSAAKPSDKSCRSSSTSPAAWRYSLPRIPQAYPGSDAIDASSGLITPPCGVPRRLRSRTSPLSVIDGAFSQRST